MKQLFTAKWVLPITKPALKDAGLVIDADRIVDVGPAARLAEKHPDAETRDFGRAIILPGFVDVHTHLEYSGLRGLFDDLPYSQWKIQLLKKSRKLEDGDWLVSARLGAVEAVQSGITTIADITNSGASLAAAKEIGLRGAVFYELSEMDHFLVDGMIKRAREDVARWRQVAEGSNIAIGIAPHSPYSACPPLIQAAAEWALDEDLRVCVHLAGSQDEYDFVKYGSSALAGEYRDLMGWGKLLWQPTGVSPVRYLLQWGIFRTKLLAVHCVHVSEQDIQILREYNVTVAHCPRCSAKLAMGIAPLRKFLDYGLGVGIGTDSPASNNTMDFFDEMRVGLLLQRGATGAVTKTEAETFVRLATIGGAGALGIQDTVGSLEPGKQADLIVVDMSHSHQRPLTDPYSALVYTANQEDVVLTVVAGKIVFDKGETAGIDVEKILRQIEPIRAKLK